MKNYLSVVFIISAGLFLTVPTESFAGEVRTDDLTSREALKVESGEKRESPFDSKTCREIPKEESETKKRQSPFENSTSREAPKEELWNKKGQSPF